MSLNKIVGNRHALIQTEYHPSICNIACSSFNEIGERRLDFVNDFETHPHKTYSYFVPSGGNWNGVVSLISDDNNPWGGVCSVFWINFRYSFEQIDVVHGSGCLHLWAFFSESNMYWKIFPLNDKWLESVERNIVLAMFGIWSCIFKHAKNCSHWNSLTCTRVGL